MKMRFPPLEAVAGLGVGDAEHEKDDRDAEQNDVDHRPSLLLLFRAFISEWKKPRKPDGPRSFSQWCGKISRSPGHQYAAEAH
jgi:hypothetical protein